MPRRRPPGSRRNQAWPPVDRLEHLAEVVAAPENEPGRGDDGVGALLAAELGAFLDSVEWEFAAAPEDGEHRLLLQRVYRVVPPFAIGDPAAVDAQDLVQFAAVERDQIGRASGRERESRAARGARWSTR